MNLPPSVKETPWDRRAFGFDTYEIVSLDAAAQAFVRTAPGHFTLKLDPLADTRELTACGFYYCDTLLVPFATPRMFRAQPDERAGICAVELRELIPLCRGVFQHGRFHRDPQIDRDAADRRYLQWLGEMCEDGRVFGLTWEGNLAAFFACRGGRALLHAVAEEYRGQGLAKHLWTAGISALFAEGHGEVSSSVSAANLAILNLYASLGFRFRDAVDIYHKWNAPEARG